MKLISILKIFVSFLLFCHCSNSKENNSVALNNYIDEAFNHIKKNSVHKNDVNWNELKLTISNKTKNVSNITQARLLIRELFDLLDDNHSLLIPSDSLNTLDNTKNQIVCHRINDSIGYIFVPGFKSEYDESLEFAHNLQNQIKQIDSESTKGWIVDLRENTGGNMWPMIAGIGPILGEGVCGYFIYPNYKSMSWSYKDGSAFLDNKRIGFFQPALHKLNYAFSKIGILIGNKTSSSGEALAISFKEKDNTKFFGEETSGKTTANQGLKLSNGDLLLIATSYFADRNQKIYEDKIVPDTIITNPEVVDPYENDKVISAAIEWIESK